MRPEVYQRIKKKLQRKSNPEGNRKRKRKLERD